MNSIFYEKLEDNLIQTDAMTILVHQQTLKQYKPAYLLYIILLFKDCTFWTQI